MKTQTEIEMRQIRKQLQQYPIEEKKKEALRKRLKELKKSTQAEKETH